VLDVDVHLLVHERMRNELCTAFPSDLDRLHFVADSFVNMLFRLGFGPNLNRIANWVMERVAMPVSTTQCSSVEPSAIAAAAILRRCRLRAAL
jgi:hypothetical protein